MNWNGAELLSVEVIEVEDNAYNGEEWSALDLSGFVNLKELRVGKGCFDNVNKLTVTGLSELKSVVIGMNSFTRKNGRFVLRNCPSLRELKIDSYSFSDYDVCEIESVDALEGIEMGNNAFYWVSLELKSPLIHSE